MHDYLTTERLILNSFGFYPIEESGYNFKRLRRICIFALFISYTAQMFLTPFFMDFSDMIEPLMIAVTEFGFLCKLVVFLNNEKNTLKLIDDLKNILSLKISCRYQKTYQKELKYTRWFANIYRTVIICYVCYLCVLNPLVRSSDKRSLPLGGYVPCDITRNDCYIFFSIYQSFTVFISPLTNVNMECVFCKLITTCCYEFDILHENLQNIDYRYEKDAEKELNHNVIFHQKLLR